MRREELKPGVTIEWPHTPGFSVVSRLVVDRFDGWNNTYVWVHHEGEGTVNCLSVEAVLRTARVAQGKRPTNLELWLIILFVILLAVLLLTSVIRP